MQEACFTEYLQGISSEGWKAFGAHFTHEYGQDGARFSVYAPNAEKVSLIGAFNGWNGYDMFRLPNGVWTIFAKDIQEGDLYKFRIETKQGETYDRADPFAFFSERRPGTASVVYRMDRYAWTDAEWMGRRGKNFNASMNIYELHAGSWKTKAGGDDRFYSYEELAERLLPYCKEMGYTHIELLPLTEHPLDASWGYQPTGYFSATSRYGEPESLMKLVDACHREGIGVILDFVPVHFVTDFYALHQFDGGFLYESGDEGQRYTEWGTVRFDYTKPHVLSFMRSALDFWIRYYHLDGVRYDAVSNLIYQNGRPEQGQNEAGLWFLKTSNFLLQQKYPGVMLIAEDSSEYLKVTAPVVYGGLGFDYKWNLGWMHDILDYLSLPPAARGAEKQKFLHTMDYFYQDIFLLPFSHDEVVHGKKTIIDKLYGDYQAKFAQARTLYLCMAAHPGKKLSFMGNELAEFKEWDEEKELGWNLLDYPAHQSFVHFIKELNSLYTLERPLFQGDYNPACFRWIDRGEGYACVFSFARKDSEGGEVIAVLNFSAHFYKNYRLPADGAGYEELIHTDSAEFGGKGCCNPKIELRAGRNGTAELQLQLAPYSGCLIKRIK